MTPKQFTATITEKHMLTPHVIHFVFHTADPSFSFTAGQYGTFIIDEANRRAYSFCGAPNNMGTFEIVIDTTPMGVGSKYFSVAKVGDAVTVLAPLGTFTLIDSKRKKVCIATGTGVAPFRSMIQSSISHVQMSLYWGLRHEEDMYWQDVFASLVQAHPSFSFYQILSQPSATWKGVTGHVTEHVIEREKDIVNTEFYLCGNSAMIGEVEQKLLSVGVLSEQIKKDLFY